MTLSWTLYCTQCTVPGKSSGSQSGRIEPRRRGEAGRALHGQDILYIKYGICIYKGGIILNSRVGHMVYNVPVHNKSLLKILFCKFIGAAYFFTSLVLLHKFYI